MITSRHDLWVYAYNVYTSPTVAALGSVNVQQADDIGATLGQPDLTDWDFYLPKNLQAAGNGSDSNTAFRAAYFFFVQTALQYCFWDFDADGNQFHWCYKGDPKAKGSRGCVALTMDMYDNGVFPGMHIEAYDVQDLLADYVADMPNAASRLAILEEVANMETFYYQVYQPLVLTGVASTKLAARMAEMFPKSFADPFLKKAQLVLGLIVSNFETRGIALKADLTAYSDYRIPQVLRHLGIIRYNAKLAAMVDSGELIESGSPEELAIRSMTILACARLAAASGLTDMEIDSWLFEQSREEDFQKNAKPFHLTKTTDY